MSSRFNNTTHSQDLWGNDCSIFGPESFLLIRSNSSTTDIESSTNSNSDNNNISNCDLECTEPSQFLLSAFLGGPRLCLDKSLALLETEMLLSMILQRYELQLINNHPKPTEATANKPSSRIRIKHC